MSKEGRIPRLRFYESRPLSPSEARREAGEILAQKGNRLLLIEAILILMLNVPLYLFWNGALTLCTELANASADTEMWSSVMVEVYALLTALTAFFLTLPSVIGLFGFAKKIACGENPVLAELFEPFSSAKCYARTLKIAWSTFWRLGLTVIALLLTSWIFSGVSPLFSGLLLFFESVGAIFLWIRRFYHPAEALARSESEEGGRMPEWDPSKHTYGAALGFFRYFLPWILLGLVTFGVLLLWDVLPQMLVAYFRYLGQENEMIIQSEE